MTNTWGVLPSLDRSYLLKHSCNRRICMSTCCLEISNNLIQMYLICVCVCYWVESIMQDRAANADRMNCRIWNAVQWKQHQLQISDHHIPPHLRNEGFHADIATKPFAHQRVDQFHDTCCTKQFAMWHHVCFIYDLTNRCVSVKYRQWSILTK